MNNKKLHDKLFRKSLSNIQVAKEFILTHVPESVLAKFDLNTITFYKSFYIENNLEEQITDIVYHINMKDGSSGYLFFLIEHQSTALKLMPFRMLKYQVAIISDHIERRKTNKLEKSQDYKLPIVFPILYYCGEDKPYPYTLNILDLFSDYALAEVTLAKPIHLVDVTVIPDQIIMQHKIVGLLEFAHKHIRDVDLSLIINDLKQIISKLNNQNIENNGLLEYIKVNLYYIIALGNFKNPDEFLKQLEEDPVIGGKIMGTLAHKFEENGIKKGIQTGKLEQAKRIALNMLRDGVCYTDITKYTGLTLEQIRSMEEAHIFKE